MASSDAVLEECDRQAVGDVFRRFGVPTLGYAAGKGFNDPFPKPWWLI
jgi:hypothetical protein